MHSISGSASSSPHRSTQDQSSPHLTHTASGSLSTHPLSKACPQPLHSGSRISPRLLRRRISHNISSLVNKFESTSTNNPTIVLPTKTPLYQIAPLQVPLELNNQGDGLYVHKQTRNATCRTSSTADTSEKYVGSEDQFNSSDDQVILETTTFMTGWNMSKRIESRCEMRSNSTSERCSETLRGSQRYPPPTLLNKVSRSPVSLSDCVASARGRLNGAVKEKVRLFDEATFTAKNVKTKSSLTSLTPIKASPGSFNNISNQSSVISTRDLELTMTPTRSLGLGTPTRSSRFHTPGQLSMERTPKSSDPFLSHENTPNPRTSKSPTKSYRSHGKPRMGLMTPEQATRAMELLTPKSTPVRYKLIPTVKEAQSNPRASGSLRGSWRKKIDNAFTLDDRRRESLKLAYGGRVVDVQEEPLALNDQRKLFARIGLRSDIFKEPSEESETLQAQKKRSSKVASLRRFFDRTSFPKTTKFPKKQENLGTSLYRSGTIKNTHKIAILPGTLPSPPFWTQPTRPWAEAKSYKELLPIPVASRATPSQTNQTELNHDKTPRTKGKIIGDKLKIFEAQELERDGKGSTKERKVLIQSTNKRSQTRNRFPRGALHRQYYGENDATERSSLRSDEVESIVEEFQTTESRLRNGKRKILFEKWRAIERSMHTTSRKDNTSIKNPALQVRQHEMVVKEAQCGLRQPKPLRIVEMKRMVLLCSDKAGGAAERDKVTQLRRLWHSYLRYSPTLENETDSLK